MTEARRKFDQDFREGAVRLVRETGKRGSRCQAHPARFTYKIALTISRRSCTGWVMAGPAAARSARQADSTGSISDQRASDRSVAYGRRSIMTSSNSTR
jgi:hypothetical protein